MTKRVLAVGGSRHGQWMDVDDKAWVWRVAKPSQPLSIADIQDPTSLSVEVPDLHETYYIERMPIAMEDFRCVVLCGIDSGLFGNARTRAVISAIFQRDIAEQFREGSWDTWV